ncbi:transmembrane and ubiquitin-like domain-containing protein 1 [Phthorimaea operculella]|nr:transmembrane and ubiquitin-like domain-containing protein 1 [Phthorimaea operculella]
MRSRAHHPVTVSIRTRPNLMVTSAQDNNSSTSTSAVSETLVSPPESMEESRESARVIPLQEMDSIVDADVAMLDNNRLHFYRRIDSPNATQSAAESSSDESAVVEEVEPASTAQIREMDSIVSAMEADVNTTTPIVDTKDKTEQNKSEDKPSASSVNATETINNVTTEQNVGGDSNAKKILIKLKYLNDTLKEVEGSLDELLKDFKWRHFSTELSGECRVRLIFNGRVLADEAATLRALGLHHRAVVHALVHPKRPTNQGPTVTSEGPMSMGARPELVGEGGAGGAGGADRSWDLENILMTLVSVALTVVWFFRCEYSNMFTASASVALFGLTVFYSVAIFGLYLSDTFHTDRRNTPPPPPATPASAPAQPVPTN